MRRQVTASLLACAPTVATAVPALAAAPAESAGSAGETTTQEVQTMPQSVLYSGQIKEIQTDGLGRVTRLVLSSDRYGEYAMNLSAATLWVDGGRHTATDSHGLAVGEYLYIFHSSTATYSLPPQSAAYVVVRNVPQDAATPQYHTVEAIVPQQDGSLKILVDRGGLYLTADADTALYRYLEGEAPTLSGLLPGDRIMAWYNPVALSHPAQSYASALMLLPEAGWEAPSTPALPEEGAALTLTLGDKTSLLTGRYESGTAMVPVAAVAQALGFQVTSTRHADGSALVTVESDQFQVRLDIGQREITGVTKIPGAVGMTAPTDYGAAPYIVDPGTTWAPARLFEMLGKTVTLEGSALSIQ